MHVARDGCNTDGIFCEAPYGTSFLWMILWLLHLLLRLLQLTALSRWCGHTQALTHARLERNRLSKAEHRILLQL